MAAAYEKFLRKNIDLAPLGLEKRRENVPYFCTPKGASVIGWGGVDGIHYCFIRGFGEMVFAVSPMNGAPHFVHPLAKDFADFLRLLLASGSCDYLEQAWQWGEAEFNAAVEEFPPTETQRAVMSRIAEQMELTAMERPWRYMKQLQCSFDYSKIPFTEEFYDLVPEEPAAPEPPQWEVYFDGNFWGHGKGQRPGKEIPLDIRFQWAGRNWIVPAVYACTKGLVVDFCIQIQPEQIRAFMEKWGLTMENGSTKRFSREERMLMELDNPMSLHFDALLQLNGRELRSSHGCGNIWNPCLPPECAEDCEGKWAAEHYGLDLTCGWVLWRSCYPWATKRKPAVRRLSMTLFQQKASIPGPHFHVHGPGDTVTFSDPEQGTEYTLTVQEWEAKKLDLSGMPHQDLEFPSHCIAMSYTITPEIPDGSLSLSDCAEGDRPRQKQRNPLEPKAVHDAIAVGLIGGADGPTAVIYGQNGGQGKLRAACSSLHFEPVHDVEWRLVFHKVQFQNQTVALL